MRQDASSSRSDLSENGSAAGTEALDMEGTKHPEEMSLKAKKKERIRALREANGITERQYHTLRIVDTFGWCTREMVVKAGKYCGISWGKIFVYKTLVVLLDQKLIVKRPLNDGTKAVAYAATDAGRQYIKARHHELYCDTNTQKDPASIFHFVELNRFMLHAVDVFPVRFLLTDFQVRSDNGYKGRNGFAKDYDSVAELRVNNRPVRIAVEFERWQRSVERYASLCATLAGERYLHLVIIALEEPSLLSKIAIFFKRLGSFVCFISPQEFIKKGAAARVSYWQGEKFFEAPLVDMLEFVSRNEKEKYVPEHQLYLEL
jgi:hypothetical protein